MVHTSGVRYIHPYRGMHDNTSCIVCIHLYVRMYTYLTAIWAMPCSKQHTAPHCTTLRPTTLQHTAKALNTLHHTAAHTATQYGCHIHCHNQHITTHCNTLQHTTTHTATQYGRHFVISNKAQTPIFCIHLLFICYSHV